MDTERQTRVRCIFILPYFGKFPAYFPLYLESCKYNSEYEWLIFTDDLTNYSYPENVKVVYKTFLDMKQLIQSKFDFPIKCDRSYKLCDYRPAFGYIFEEYVKEYEFWGHVDCDCVWGRLNKFITSDVLEKYDRIYALGHLSLLRNTPENNRMFRRTLNQKERYKEVFSMEDNLNFDECNIEASIGDIYLEYGISVYEDRNRADLNDCYPCFEKIDYNPVSRTFTKQPVSFMYYIWDKGFLKEIRYSYFKKKTQECSYIHFHGGTKFNHIVSERVLISAWKLKDDMSFHKLKVMQSWGEYMLLWLGMKSKRMVKKMLRSCNVRLKK